MLFFVTGAAVGVAGMIIDQSWLIWLAIGILAVGLLLRMYSRMTARGEDDDAIPDDDPDGTDETDPDASDDFEMDLSDDETSRLP